MKLRESPDKLDDLRGKILKLAVYQRKLFEATSEYLKSHAGGIAKLAHDIGADWHVVNRFARDGRPLYRGLTLPLLTKAIDCQFLCKLIETEISGVDDRWCGLSMCSDDVINLVFDLHEAKAKTGRQMLVEQFAEFFRPEQRTVEKLLYLDAETARLASDGEISAKIRRVLQDTDWTNAVSPNESPNSGKMKRLQDAYEQFKRQFPTIDAQGSALHMDIRTIRGALAGRSTEKTVRNLLRKISKHLVQAAPDERRQAAQPRPVLNADKPPDERKLIRWFVSNLNSTANLLDLINQAGVVDGDRAHIIRFMANVCKRFGINHDTLAKLNSTQAVSESDYNAVQALLAFSGRRKKNAK